MAVLILGLVLWYAAHLFNRVLPEVREKLGKKGRGIVAVLNLTAVVLMVLGYRAADTASVYTPIHGVGHLNNLLMLVALFVYGSGKAKGRLSNVMRHPMLIGVIIFAISHLLVNGDLASLVLFGGLGIWALVEIIVINRAVGPWQPTKAGTAKGDLRAAVITIVVYAVIAALHIWSGHNPFLGTYA